MKTTEIRKSSTNRGEFNRAYKAELEKTGKIHCSYCKYHKGENKTTKHYGGFDGEMTHPNWKLVSKNRKQWMPKKSLKIKTETIRRYSFMKQREYSYYEW